MSDAPARPYRPTADDLPRRTILPSGKYTREVRFMFTKLFAAVGFVVVVLSILVCAGAGDRRADDPTPPTPSPGRASRTAAVTLAEYDAVKVGMSLAEVERVIGARGVEQSRNEIAGVETVLVEWRNGDGLSAMNAIFQGGELVQKSQVGLK